MTGSILGWCHTNDGCAQTQEHSIKRANQTLLKPEIPAWKENWHRAFLRFGCALRWRSGCCRITTDNISKLTQMMRDRRATKSSLDEGRQDEGRQDKSREHQCFVFPIGTLCVGSV